MAKKVTMAQLAKLAGVDVSTVSRAMNNSPLVKPDTKELVLRIADEVGYSVNVAARNLRRQSSETIALVIPLRQGSGETISDPFFLEMVGAVSMAASRRGYDLLLSTPDDETAIAERRLLKTGRADGLIIIGQAGRENRLQSISELESRFVVWGGLKRNTPYTLIGSDNIGGAKQAVSHLIKLGRKRILFIGDTELPEIALRYEGYIQAHGEHGQIVDPSLIMQIGFGHQVKKVSPKLNEAIKSGLNFDGIFGASDALSLRAIEALRQNNLNVPKDVAVIGYDNIGQSALSQPSLTTVSQNIEEGGELLVSALIDKLNGRPVGSKLTKTELIIRESCGGL